MDGQTMADPGDDKQDAAEQRRERRLLIRQLLLDWSPVAAGVTALAVRHLL